MNFEKSLGKASLWNTKRFSWFDSLDGKYFLAIYMIYGSDTLICICSLSTVHMHILYWYIILTFGWRKMCQMNFKADQSWLLNDNLVKSYSHRYHWNGGSCSDRQWQKTQAPTCFWDKSLNTKATTDSSPKVNTRKGG